MIYIDIDVITVDDELRGLCRDAGITVVGFGGYPLSVIFKGDRGALIGFVHRHWAMPSREAAETLVDHCTMENFHD